MAGRVMTAPGPCKTELNNVRTYSEHQAQARQIFDHARWM
jgi:hypothetical protein